MINEARRFTISELFPIGEDETFQVPRYQRLYSWTKTQWDYLFDDIAGNDEGYFLGSIICVGDSKQTSTKTPYLEVIDGQQRLTSIVLLLSAIHGRLLKAKDNLDEIQRNDLYNLKRRILTKSGEPRFLPQEQNDNRGDFLAVLEEAGLRSAGAPVPKHAGNRRIMQAFKFFSKSLDDLLSSDKQYDAVTTLFNYADKVTKACVVKIEVLSYADAFVLFQSLNDRGQPITAVDLIKSSLLAKMKDDPPKIVERVYAKWDELLGLLTDDYVTQERFFRYYYDAFQEELLPGGKPKQATKSNLITIYDTLIVKKGAFLDAIIQAGKSFSLLIGGDTETPISHDLRRQLFDLRHIQGSPSYVLLLYLLGKREKLRLEDEHLAGIVRNLVCFFVRRSITDTPPTRDLITFFIHIIEKIGKIKNKSGKSIAATITNELKGKAAGDLLFQEKLQGPLYDENKDATRFLLCSLEEEHTGGKDRDLWEQNGKNYEWTIEHIFPEGGRIPDPWVAMIAGGNKDNAKDIQARCVHKLGNLTVTGYNSSLGNKSFSEKKDRKKEEKYVGYRNGLYLNEDVVAAPVWTEVEINQRTEKLAGEVFSLFQFR